MNDLTDVVKKVFRENGNAAPRTCSEPASCRCDKFQSARNKLGLKSSFLFLIFKRSNKELLGHQLFEELYLHRYEKTVHHFEVDVFGRIDTSHVVVIVMPVDLI